MTTAIDHSQSSMNATSEKWLQMFRRMQMIRHFEEQDKVNPPKAGCIARRRNAMLVDWRFHSTLTTEDSNFWDTLHYRLPIAYRLIDDLEHIVREGREAPDGSYRVLVR